MKKVYILLVAAFAAPALMFAQPANSTCDTAPVADIVTDGPTVTITGTGTDAIDADGLGSNHVWEAFTITECSNVTLDFCETTEIVGYFSWISSVCPVDLGNSATTLASENDFVLCANGNLTSTWGGLEPGTYYYPISSDANFGPVLDSYTINITATACAAEPDTCLNFDNGLNDDLGSAPAPNMDGDCEANSLNYGVWANEAYEITDFVAGTTYTFSICDGPDAGTWESVLAVIDPNENVVAFVEGCSVTWTAEMDGTYIIGISESGNCFNSTNTNVDNGNATINCEGTTQPANSTCDTAPVADLVTDGPTVTVTGSGTNAINNNDELDAEHVWEAFTITECSDVTIDLCGTDPVQGALYPFVTNTCPLDLENSETVFGFADLNFSSCADGNPTISWINLEPGTYYYPIISSADSQVLDNYTVNFTAVTCTGEPDTCLVYANGPWPNFNSLGGAPTPDAEGVCETVALDFGCWASESYFINGFAADVMYTFSICEGIGAGSWSPAISVTDPNGDLVAYVEDCSVTWTTEMDGTYIIGISEVGHCFDSENTGTDNGNPTLSCEGSVGVSEVDKADFSIFPNPSNGQFSIRNAGVAGNYDIHVLDMAGRLVHSQKSILSSNTIVDVNVNGIANGVYMVKMTNTLDNSSTTQRVVVQ